MRLCVLVVCAALSLKAGAYPNTEGEPGEDGTTRGEFSVGEDDGAESATSRGEGARVDLDFGGLLSGLDGGGSHAGGPEGIDLGDAFGKMAQGMAGAFGGLVCQHRDFTAAAAASEEACGDIKKTANQKICGGSCKAAMCQLEAAMRTKCGSLYEMMAKQIEVVFEETCGEPMHCTASFLGGPVFCALLVLIGVAVLYSLVGSGVAKGLALGSSDSSSAATAERAEELRRRRMAKFGAPPPAE